MSISEKNITLSCSDREVRLRKKLRESGLKNSERLKSYDDQSSPSKRKHRYDTSEDEENRCEGLKKICYVSSVREIIWIYTVWKVISDWCNYPLFSMGKHFYFILVYHCFVSVSLQLGLITGHVVRFWFLYNQTVIIIMTNGEMQKVYFKSLNLLMHNYAHYVRQ